MAATYVKDSTESETRTVGDIWAVVQEQRAQMEALKAELQKQRMEKVSLSSRMAEMEGGESNKERRLSRAGMLKAAAVGAAGVTAAGIMSRPEVASASTATMLTGTNNYVDDATGLVIPTGGAFPSNKDWMLWADGGRYSDHNVDGLRGSGSAAGNGVTGWAGAAGGSGVRGLGYTKGVALLGEGGRAQLRLAPGPTAGPPTTGTNYRGDVYMDSTGALFRCYADGPGFFAPLSTFQPFPDPRRVFGDGTMLAAGTTTGAIDATAGSGAPAGAKAAYCAVQATNPGVMTLFPDGSSDPGIANWANTGSPGQLALYYMLVPLSAAGKFRIHNYFTGQVYVDVWGYLM
ncbi:MAG: hypothetical protein NVS2B16_30330 [Chloroflexota bacterium]